MKTVAENLKKEIADCTLQDRQSLLRRFMKMDPANKEKLEKLKQEIIAAQARKAKKIATRPLVNFAMDLPIHERLDDIREAIHDHQLIVLCGETGSGKTTQLPKLCLDMGRGIDGQIGHTQPRRIAAKAVAARIAEELHTSIGETVGYKIRHTDTTSANTCIKLMTDGILLAELQRDRALECYDTLIIDEAHERSLNIDFILGYIKQLLPKRPDLRVIVTSATIDVDRFSSHFDNAPVIEVSGRSYPVEVRYRPVEVDEIDEDVEQQALLNAVNELTEDGKGDILVFLEGEREIHETAKFLNKQKLKGTDILPLYSRLSSVRQANIFKSHNRRHIILATNVAETSLTIPGIRYVIDRGFARISRYNRRNKVQQLPVEKISRSSAEQRKGRCGRMADGICLRLYTETDFDSRTEFTDPEILRTSLASVILQMKTLNLGDITDFPFINKPDIRFVNDGIRLLIEIGALNKNGELTHTGKLLAKLPLDPRLGRILLAAGIHNCVRELMIIISALSINDPRERPMDMQQKADEAHDPFNDERSDFLFFLNLWNFYQEQSKKLSQNRLRKLCHQNFISYVRMREWAEVRQQLQELLSEINVHPSQIPSDYNNIHCAILYGFLGQIGLKTDMREYTGARGIKFSIFPGSSQFKKLPKWVVAAELVETSKLYARYVASIDPQWLLRPAEHLLQREYSEPNWNTRSQQVMANEKISLYGLVLSANQKVNYGKINPQEARTIFIRNALVEGKYQTSDSFFSHNIKIIEAIRLLERKSRRHDILNEEALYDFYDKYIPADIYNGPLFKKWYQSTAKINKKLLWIKPKDVMYHEADTITESSYPDALKINNNKLPINYKFEPETEDDGVNIDIPLIMLNQVEREQLDYLVPGMLEEKITLLLKGLPKNIRKKLVPLPDTAKECAKNLQTGNRSLLVNLTEYLFRTRGIKISQDSWSPNQLPDYLKINIRVLDESGNIINQSRDFDALKKSLAGKIQSQFKDISISSYERTGIVCWDFDDLPDVVNMEINNKPVLAYPGFIDNHDSVSIRLFDTKDKAYINTQRGLIRLFKLELRKDFNYLRKNLPHYKQMGLYYTSIGNVDAFGTDLLNLIAKQTFLADGRDIKNKREFTERRDEGSAVLISEANSLCDLVKNILVSFHELQQRLSTTEQSMDNVAILDISDHMNNLVYDGFLKETSIKLLLNYPRYLDAIGKRLDKLSYSPEKDRKQLVKLKPFWSLYKEMISLNNHSDNICHEIEEYRFMLEEFRISLFAQEVGTVIPVSSERLQKYINRIRIRPASSVTV